MASANMQRMVRMVALFDLLVTAPLALPELSNAWVALLLSGFGFLGSPSAWLPLPLTTSLFCVLAGILGVLWNGCRLLRPDALLVRADIWGRIAVAAALIYFMVAHQAPVIFWAFVATELGGALIERRALSTMRGGGDWA
jgi:hypothetical protein